MWKKSVVCEIIIFLVGLSIIPLASSLAIEKYIPANFQQCKNGARSDTTPPVTTISFDPETPDGDNLWYVSNVTITLYATDDSSGVNVTYYRVNNGTWEIYEHPFVFNMSNYYMIDYYSIDNAGNVESVKFSSCKVDVVPPVTTIHIYGIWGENGWLKRFDKIELSAKDDMSGVKGIRYDVDGSGWKEYSAPFHITTDSLILRFGFLSIDRAGNLEDPQYVEIKVDGTPPDMTLTAKKIWINMWKFTVEAFDGRSSVDKVEFYLDNQLLGTVMAPGPYEWIWNGTGCGNHTVRTIAYDVAGNNASVSTIVHSYAQTQSEYHPKLILLRQTAG